MAADAVDVEQVEVLRMALETAVELFSTSLDELRLTIRNANRDTRQG